MQRPARLLGLIIVAILASVAAMPGVSTADDETSSQFWADLILAFPQSDKLYFDVGLRTEQQVSGGEPYRSYMAVPLVAYYPGPWVDLSFDMQFKYTNQVEGLNTFEIRPRIGAKLHILANFREKRGFERVPTSKFYIGTLLRIEFRNIKYSDDTPDAHETRFRGRIETQIALNHSRINKPGTAFVLFDGEAFVTLSGDAATERYASRFRVRIGFGYRFSYKYRLELIYIGDDNRASDDEDFSINSRMLDLRLKILF
jgi:hypothetical protein